MVCCAERERLPALALPALLVLGFRSGHLLSGERGIDILRSVGPGAGAEEAARMMFRTTFSKGRPSFSYIAMRNAGSMIPSMRNMAPVPADGPTGQQIDGDAHQPPPPKQISCRLVRLNASLVLTLDRSLGTFT